MILFFSHVSSLEWNAKILPLQSYKSPIPYDAYDYLFPSYKKSLFDKDFHSTIGQKLTGLTEKLSPFHFTTGDSNSSSCVNFQNQVYSPSEKENLISLIKKDYQVQLILEGAPLKNRSSNKIHGFKIGYESSGQHFINNIFHFSIYYTKKTKDEYIITDFYIDEIKSFNLSSCENSQNKPTPLENSSSISFSYTYSLIETSLSLNKNSELFQKNQQQKINLFIAFLPSLFFGILALIFYIHDKKSTVNRGNDLLLDDADPLDEASWKLVHGDVFRMPNQVIRLCSLFGFGNQFIFSLILASLFSSSISESYTQFITLFLQFFSFSFALNGYLSSQLFKTIGQMDWRNNMIKSWFIPIAFIFSSYAISSLFYYRKNSTAKPSFSGLISIGKYSIFGLLMHILGSLVGLKMNPISISQRINQLARQIPPQIFISKYLCFVFGLLASISIHPLGQSILQFYWLGEIIDKTEIKLEVVALLIGISTAGVVSTQQLLDSENYKWWWNSVRVGICPGIVLFFEGVAFFLKENIIQGINGIGIFFFKNLITCLIVAAVCASASFSFSFIFVRSIFLSLKME